MGYGDRMTEQEFRALRARVDGIYRQAYREIDEKAKEFARRHAVREARYRQQVQNGKLSQQDFDAWMRGQVFQGRQWQAQRQQMADTLYHADEVAQAMVNEGRFDVFAANANYMGYQMEMATGLNTSFTLYDANTVRRLAMDNPDLLPPKKAVGKDKAYQWYNRQMENVITQGIIQGESISEIAHRMAKTTGETNRAAMLRNARTMYTGAENAGRVEGMRQAEELGIKVQKKWRALLDKRTRESHRQLDSQIADVDKPFKSILGPIRYPGDPAADPANVWNCHCTLISVYPDYPGSAKRRDNETGEIIGDVSYKEWEQGKKENQPSGANTGRIIEPTIAGVIRGAIMSHEEADSGRVNPHFGENPAYGINCQSCVMTYEARRRGYDVEVVPNDANHPMCYRLASDTLMGYKNADGTPAQFEIGGNEWQWSGSWKGETPTAKRYEKMLEQTLQEGARYTMQFKWRGYDAGHIVTLRKDPDGLAIYDPQCDRTYKGKDFSDYLKRLQYKRQYRGATYYNWPGVIRTDDKAFNFDVVNAITRRKGDK